MGRGGFLGTGIGADDEEMNISGNREIYGPSGTVNSASENRAAAKKYNDAKAAAAAAAAADASAINAANQNMAGFADPARAARLRQQRQAMGGTLLTSPLGINNTANVARHTLLGA